MRKIRFVLLTAVLAASCGGAALAPDAGDPNDGSADASVGDDGARGCDPSLTYASFGMTFFGTYCARCHGFDQQSAQLSGSVIVSAAGTGTFMPPSDPKPSPLERQELTSWIDCGAP